MDKAWGRNYQSFLKDRFDGSKELSDAFLFIAQIHLFLEDGG